MVACPFRTRDVLQRLLYNKLSVINRSVLSGATDSRCGDWTVDKQSAATHFLSNVFFITFEKEYTKYYVLSYSINEVLALSYSFNAHD